MKKYLYILLIAIAAIVIGGVYFALQNPEADAPWIEVINPKIFAGQEELKNGDKLEVGWEIRTNDSGKAIIHFSNGSTANLEPNTSLTIKNVTGNATSLFLKFGEVISQVETLVTPESVWEVKTANAVTVVRGTKYSVKYDKEKSVIKVFEGSVLVAVIDPKTGLIIEGTELLLDAGYFTEIDQKNVELKKRPGVFEAVLIFSDGASKIVTEEVEWQLSDDKNEIDAIWRDPATGRELRGETKISDN